MPDEEPAASIELNQDIVALFAGMELRRAAKAARRRPHATPSERKAGNEVTMPEREDAAARKVQKERQRARAQQEHLYGSRAAEVRALEANLNQSYDHAVRNFRPPTWPSVPMR